MNYDYAKEQLILHTTKKTNDIIHIAYATDNNYAEPTCISMASVMFNTNSLVHFHIIEKNLSEHNKAMLMSFTEKNDNSKVTLHKIHNENINNLPQSEAWPIEACFRLFLAELLPELDKIIWLDGDTVVEGNLSQLWNFGFTGKYAAAVPCTLSVANHLKELFGIDWYFNSGVMLFDLRALRSMKFASKVPQVAQKLYEKCKKANLPWYPDQNILNYLLNKHVATLPQKMNVFPYTRPNQKDSDCGHLKEYVDALISPMIIHFHFGGRGGNGVRSPFVMTHQRKCVDLEKLKRYFFYKAMTSFSDESKDYEQLQKYESLKKISDCALFDDEYDYILRNMRDTFKQLADKLATNLGGRRLAFWGAGIAIRTMLVEFAAKGLYADTIVDGSPEKQGSSIFHYFIQNPEVLAGKSNEFFVVMSMINRKPVAEVTKILTKYGYAANQYCYIFEPLWDFINEEL